LRQRSISLQSDWQKNGKSSYGNYLRSIGRSLFMRGKASWILRMARSSSLAGPVLAVVRAPVARHPCHVVNINKLTYADSLSSCSALTATRTTGSALVGDLRCASCSRNTSRTKVMNLAAESHVDRSIDGPGDFIQTSIVGTFTLLQEARTLPPPGRAGRRTDANSRSHACVAASSG